MLLLRILEPASSYRFFIPVLTGGLLRVSGEAPGAGSLSIGHVAGPRSAGVAIRAAVEPSQAGDGAVPAFHRSEVTVAGPTLGDGRRTSSVAPEPFCGENPADEGADRLPPDGIGYQNRATEYDPYPTPAR